MLKVSDDIWNDVGRPASDAALSILFPGGASFYVDGDVTQQPDKMDLLVQLLQVNIHPKLSDTVRLASIATVQTESAALRAAVTAATTVQTKLELLKQMERAVATAAAIELANYKRLLKANGYTEAEAHKIIPDHNAPSPKPKGAAPAAPAAPPPAAPPPAPPAPTPPATPPDPNNPNG